MTLVTPKGLSKPKGGGWCLFILSNTFLLQIKKKPTEAEEATILEKRVLDTNVLMDKPFESVLESFDEPTHVILPHVVLKELDKYKNGNEPRNEHTRAATRLIDDLRSKGSISEGVIYTVKGLDHKIQVKIDMEDLDLDKPDYKIIKTAKDENATLVTQDINERVVADALKVKVTNYAPSNVDVNKLYTGHRDLTITDEESIELGKWESEGIPVGNRRLVNNQFVTMKDSNGATYEGIYDANDKTIYKLENRYEAWGVKPKKDKKGDVVAEQKYLMHLLMDPSIEFVTAIGPSGCGKTLLTLAAALEQTERGDQYNKITVMRPLVAAGDDIGFLPGDKLEKLEPWMASTFDALDYLLEDYHPKDGSMHMGSKEKIYGLIGTGRLELEAMAHIRGRSIPNQFIIVDDAQNLTPHQAATIITRAGEGSKLVFLGDLSEKQIDNHRLTSSSNGLAYVIDKMKGEDIVGHITLNTVVRSRLAQLGVEKL